MLTKTVLEFFSKNGDGVGGTIATAKMLGIGSGAVCNWGPTVPRGLAFELQHVTDGLLQVDLSVYKPHKRDTPELRKAMQDHCKAKRKNKAG